MPEVEQVEVLEPAAVQVLVAAPAEGPVLAVVLVGVLVPEVVLVVAQEPAEVRELAAARAVGAAVDVGAVAEPLAGQAGRGRSSHVRLGASVSPFYSQCCDFSSDGSSQWHSVSSVTCYLPSD